MDAIEQECEQIDKLVAAIKSATLRSIKAGTVDPQQVAIAYMAISLEIMLTCAGPSMVAELLRKHTDGLDAEPIN